MVAYYETYKIFEREDALMKRLDNLEGCEDNPVYAAEIRDLRRELQQLRSESLQNCL